MNTINIYKELQKFNFIKFEAIKHYYYIDNIRTKSSSTGLISQFKQEFKADYWAGRKAKELGIDKIEVLSNWKDEKNKGIKRGIDYHSFIENYLANRVIDDIANYPSWWKFWERDNFKLMLTPVVSEVIIGDRSWNIGGTIDQLFINNETGELEIWDWKTNKKFERTSSFKFRKPISKLTACEFNTYALQLSIYKLILERNTELKVAALKVLWLSPDDEYEVIELPYLEEEALKILNY